MTTPLTLEDLDLVVDELFHDLAHDPQDTPISITDEEREAMRAAYSGMVEASDPDVRELMEPAEALSDWGLYASLRMNGVDFRTPAPTFGR